jgi:hypothetical protein
LVATLTVDEFFSSLHGIFKAATSMEADRFNASMPLLCGGPELPNHGGTKRLPEWDVSLQQVPSHGFSRGSDLDLWLHQLPDFEPGRS